MTIESHARVCIKFRQAFPDAQEPSYAACRWLNEADVARAIERVMANPLSGKQADLAKAVIDAAGARNGRSRLVKRK